MKKFYEVAVRVKGEEIYIVEAETAEEAKEKWFDNEPEYTDIFEADVMDVTEVE